MELAAVPTTRNPVPLLTLHPERPSDYEVVRRAIEFISLEWRDQPSLEKIAAHVGQKPLSLQRLFTRWAGLSPKGLPSGCDAGSRAHASRRFRHRARRELRGRPFGAGPAARSFRHPRGHDARRLQGARARGSSFATASIRRPSARRWSWSPSTASPASLSPTKAGRRLALADMRGALAAGEVRRGLGRDRALCPPHLRPGNVARRPAAPRRDDRHRFRAAASGRRCSSCRSARRRPIPTSPPTSAGPSAARAVGTAVGKNPISFVVPCHRVLGKDGGLHGYHWGLTRKRAILGWEAAYRQ